MGNQQLRGSAMQPISLAQKCTLIATYQRTKNMALAMREADIKSPRTAYLWWHRYCEQGEAGLQAHTHARKTQQTISTSIATSIYELKRAYPTWGRRRIAEELSNIYGHRVVSPSGVEAVLQRADLWKRELQSDSFTSLIPTFVSESWLTAGKVDEEKLLSLIQRGLTLSFRDHAQDALTLLWNQLWLLLQDDVLLWNKLMRTQIGKWLLRTRVALGHDFMNTGQWEQARAVLEETIAWMQENEFWLRQQVWEEDLSVNLRWSDAWVECHQYLGIVLQHTDYERAQGYLLTALSGIQRQWKPVIPRTPQAIVSNIKRDIVSLKIKSGRVMGRGLERELEETVTGLDPLFLVPGKEAGIAILWAGLYAGRANVAGKESHSERIYALGEMEQAAERAITLVRRDPSPMLQANFLAETAQLYQAHDLQFDIRFIQTAAHLCLLHGFRHQAQELLHLSAIGRIVDDEVLHRLIRLAYSY